MKSLLLVAILSLSVGGTAFAKKDKGHVEPAPKERDERKGGGEQPDSREETYEGNDRTDGGHLDDGDGFGGGEGGMIGELFYVPGNNGGKTYPVQSNVKKEDRGDVVVYTTTVHEDISASETCTTVTVTVVDKKTQKTIKTDSNEYCNTWPL